MSKLGVKVKGDDGKMRWLKTEIPPSRKKDFVRFNTAAQAVSWMRRRSWISEENYAIKPIDK